MLFNRKLVKTSKRHHAWLYYCVFTGRLATLAVFLLFTSFLLQPFHQALAYESEVAASEEVVVAADDVKPQLTNEEPPPEILPEITNDEIASNEPEEAVVEEDVVEDTSPEEIIDTNEVVNEDVSETPILVETPSTDDEALIKQQEEQTETESNNVEISTSTENSITAASLITDENYFQFSKQACVAVGEGAYHCATKVADAIDAKSVVYSELSEKGNLEIFIKTATGRIEQLTDNEFDDSAPSYDPESRQVVWQRLIDGRYQVVVASLDDNNETQLTFSKTNNMEPKVSKAGVVWQAWDGSDWEVMYFDGSYTEQITDNDAQDVAPVIQDGYVLWSVLGLNEQQARVYSLESKITTSIVGHEGGSVANPRFVLVYDTKFENGDVITQGFDPATGLSAPITATPAPEPVSIPDSDPLGEIRALIQNKSSQKDEFDTPDLDSEPDPINSTSTTLGTLDLKNSPQDTVSQIVTANPPLAAPLELTEYDLVIVDLESVE